MVLHQPVECTRVTGKVPCNQINLGGYRVYQDLARDSSKSNLQFVKKSFPPALTVDILGHANIDVTQNVPNNLRPSAFEEHKTGMRKLPKCPLTLESAGSESLQKVAANVPVQNGLRVCTCEIGHRGAYAFVDRGQKIGVNVAHMGPGLHGGHTRDLSEIIDIASRDDEEVGIFGN